MEICLLDETLRCPQLFQASCAFGVFDGVHQGHRFLIKQALDSARRRQVPSAILTFDHDPDEEFRPAGFTKLMTNKRRLETLGSMPVDAVVIIPFSQHVQQLPPTEFLDKLFGPATPSEIHVGFDFRYGDHALGDVASMMQWGEAHGMGVEGHGLLELDGAPVTATRIRRALAQGHVEEAARWLGAPYSLEAIVETGRGEGRDFGIRTANLSIPERLLAVGEGVYGCYAIVEGKRYKAAVSVGVTPTFQQLSHANVEAHLLDFEGDLYGKPLILEFIAWLRPMREFQSQEELITTITSNIDWVRENL